VHFSVAQAIAAPCEHVETALIDPRFYQALAAMPNIGNPEVLHQEEKDGLVHLGVRYAFTGDLAPAARRVLDPSKLTWVVELTVNRATRQTAFRMVPDHYQHRLECEGTYVLRPDGPDATIQHIEGDLRVHYPIVGKVAERGIVTGLKDHMAQEAAFLAKWRS